MELQDLLKKSLPQIPLEISNALRENAITSTSFACKNRILSSDKLQNEVGYIKMDHGTYLVDMICPMPGITVDMIEWWFWWHPQDNTRYQVWYPNDHVGIHYHKKDRTFFEQPSVPAFTPNTQFPTERIGGVKMPLRIDFVTPEEFGFSPQAICDNNVAKIICGHVGAFNNLVRHTEMAHIFKKTENGLFLISRFWLGETLKNPILKKLIVTDAMAKSMAEHCCIEYRNLCEILPDLYNKYR